MGFLKRILAFCLLAACLPTATAQVTGATPWAVLLCKLHNQPDEPYKAADIEKFFTEDGAGTGGMFDFFDDMSFGAVDITGTRVMGWFDAGLSLSFYKDLMEEGNAGRMKAVQYCVDAAVKQGGLVTTDFWGAVVVWNINNPSIQAWGANGRAILPPNTWTGFAHDRTTAAWAMSRAYGAQIGSAVGSPVPRADPWNLMSCPTCLFFTDPAFGPSGPGLSGANRASLGWIPPSRLVVGPAGTRTTIKLDSLSDGSGVDALVARTFLSAGDYWDVSLRTSEAWDVAFGVADVHVHRVAPDGTPDFEGFRFGRVFDRAADRQVRLVSMKGRSAEIEIGPAGPLATGLQHPPRPATAWNNTPVEVTISAGEVVARGIPLFITYEANGAQSLGSTTDKDDVSYWINNDGMTLVSFFAHDADGNVGDAGVVQVYVDRMPPVSSATTAPAPSGGYVATITAKDPVSGVKEVHFLLNGVGPETVVQGDRATANLPASGWSTLVYWSVDRAGNVEYPYNTLTVGPRFEYAPKGLKLTGPIGQWGPRGIVTVSNSGTQPIAIRSVTSDSHYFRASPVATCVGTLLPHTSCNLGVEYYAPTIGTQTGTLFIATDDFHYGTVIVALSGTATQPEVAFTPNPVNFPNTFVGMMSAPQTVRISNTGNGTLTIQGITTGTTAFPIASDRCGPKPYSLPPGGQCEVDVGFAPQGHGTNADALTVTSNIGTPRSVPLLGYGIGNTNIVVPPPVDFGTVAVGQRGRRDIEIRNLPPGAPYMIRDFTISGSTLFQVARAQCTNGVPPTSLEQNQVCVVTLLYTPTAAGSHSATLQMNSAVGQPTVTMSLGGAAQ